MSKLNNQLYEVNNQRQRGNYSPNLVYLSHSGDTIGDKEQAGGGPMDPKYVTKEELKTLDTKIDGKLNTMSATINGRFDGLEKDNKHLSKLLWWLMGIVSAGVVLPLLALALKILFSKL